MGKERLHFNWPRGKSSWVLMGQEPSALPLVLSTYAIYRVCGLAVTAGIAMKFGTAHGRSRLGVGGAKCIGSYGRKGVPPAPCNFGAS